MRKNGWETPFHVLQLATWVVFPAVMALFFIFYTPVLNKTLAIVLSIVYATACLITVMAVALCTGTDPSDDCITIPSVIVDARESRSENRVYCNVCMKFVNDQSRHCRLCDKCVDVFDHHCKWLNNCVGRKNYQYFLCSVVGASVFLAVQIAVGIYVVVKLFTDEDDIMERSATSFGCSIEKDDSSGLCEDGNYRVPLQALQIVHIVLLAFLSPWLFMIGQLALFHFHLCMEHITTYDYIVRQRKRKNAQNRENSAHVPWWKRCCGGQSAGPHSAKPIVNQSNGSRMSGESARSEEEELAAIEAEVDDSLDVLSNQSGEIRERESSQRSSSSLRKRTSNNRPKRGFSLHVDLSGQKSVQTTGGANGDVLTPRSESGDTNYLAAPYFPETPDSLVSPRSAASSAYYSSSQVDETENRDVGESTNHPHVMSSNASTVTYGRLAVGDDSANSPVV